jgi:cytochrome P450
MMEAGSDTSASIVIAFVQTIVRYSRVQKKEQRQIDEVFRPDRTPQWSDYSKLPYVAQCVNEATRWRPVANTTFTHALAEGMPSLRHEFCQN